MDLGSLRQIESLADLSPSQLAQASRRLVWRHYAAGELIVPHTVHIHLQGIVYRGRIKVSVVQRGQRHTVGYIHAEEAINGRYPASSLLPVELRAVEATTLCLLPPDERLVRNSFAAPSSRPTFYGRLHSTVQYGALVAPEMGALSISHQKLDELHPVVARGRAPSLRRRRNLLMSLGVCLLAIALLIGFAFWRWPALWQIPSSKLMYGLASYRLEEGSEVCASRLLQASIDLNPSLDLAHNDLGTIYYHRGQLRQAQASFRHAVVANPDSAVAWNNLGLTYLDSGELVLAREALQRAVALNPESAAAWANLGLTAHRLERVDEAFRAYRMALRLDPDNIVVQANLGILYYEREQIFEARDRLQSALDGHPFLPRARAILGAIALREGDHDRAGTELDLVRSDLADDPLFHFYLALWYEEAGNGENAITELNRALALGPDSELAALIHSHLVDLSSFDPSHSVEELKGE